MEISHLDQFVLTMKNIPTTVDFYCSIMGMQATSLMITVPRQFLDNKKSIFIRLIKSTGHCSDYARYVLDIMAGV